MRTREPRTTLRSMRTLTHLAARHRTGECLVRLTRRTQAATLFLFVMLAWSVAGSASAHLPSGNLLANSSAEAGPGGLDGTATVGPVPSWHLMRHFNVVSYGAHVLNFAITPPPSFARSIGAGFQLFTGGNTGADSSAAQTVSLSGERPEIAAGGAKLTLRAYLGGYGAQNDRMRITVYELGRAHNIIGSFAIGPVSAASRHDQTALLRRSASSSVPSRTVAARVVIQAIHDSGTYNNALADTVTLTIGRS